VRTVFVVVIDEFAEDRFQLVAMEHEHPVKALASYRPDESLGERIRTRGPNGRTDNSDAVGSEHLIEARGEFRISVPDQELRRATLFN
jgi:hypothetical protein